MGNDMFLRQSIIRCGTADRDRVIDGLAAWVTVLFDLGNLRHDRTRALELKVEISDGAIVRLVRALSNSRNGCILAVPHIGSIELFVAHLKDRGVDLGFVYTIGETPTPTERWILDGRAATGATPIAFGRRNTGVEISKILRKGGVVLMVVDVYPSAKYKGIGVNIHEAEFSYPPGPARFARSGTLVLPGFASLRDAKGVFLNILDPLEYRALMPGRDAIADFTQRLAVQIASFTTEQPPAYWLWHPIPNDPFLAAARRHRPDLLSSVAAAVADDEAVALAVEALHSTPTQVTKARPDRKKPTGRPSLRADLGE
jgi:lauroyl/myristoyl acyltransferase